jgi:geranylgeranyl diphosphate synthase type II
MNNLDNLVVYFEKAFSEEIKKIGQTAPQKLYEPIAYALMIGGKRIRPALMLHAASLFSINIDHVLSTAMAIEIFHNFTLLHDDIMDKAELRRGMPTVHKKYNENVAILSGDAMSILAFKYFAKDNHSKLAELLPLFTKTSLEVCEGQQFDMDFENNDDVTVDEYLEMIRLKTAVLIASSLKIGALMANSNQADADLLYEYGINLGLAFQLQDDWLDVYGNPELFGKKQGGDICANKKTFLLLKAKEACDPLMLKQLNHWLSESNITEERKIAAITDIYNKTGVSTSTKNLMQSYHQKALIALGKVSVADDQKIILINFANELMQRVK